MAIGTIAINAGIAIASNLLIGLLTPSNKTGGDSKRPDLESPKSEFGAGIWKIYGTVRRNALPLIWADTLDRIVKEEERGGKGGGGGGQTVEKVFYLMDAAWLIGEPIDSVSRIWLNGKLMWSAYDTTEDGQDFINEHVEIYDGTQTTPDPTIMDHEDDSPSFTGRSYIVIRDLDTKRFEGGTSLPKIDVEVKGTTSNPNGSVGIEDIFEDILLRAGLAPTEFDLSAISGIHEINGFPLKNEGEDYRSILEELMEYFQIISYDLDGVRYFVKQKQPSVTPLKIPESAIGTKELEENQKNLFTERKINESSELPSRIEIEYKNINNNHDAGHQEIYNPIRRNDNPKTINTDMVANDALALQIITNLLNQIETQKFKYEKIFLPPDYYSLKPGDRILLPIRGYHEQCQVKKVSLNANFTVELEAAVYGFRAIRSAPPNLNVNYSKYDVGYGGTQVFDSQQDDSSEESINVTESTSTLEDSSVEDVDPGITYSANNTQPTQHTKAIPHPLDIPLITETDTENGIYVAIQASQPWYNGEIHVSMDDESNYIPSGTALDVSVLGSVTSGSLDSGYSVGDDDTTSSIEVTLLSGISKGLKNVTENEFLVGKQLALMGGEIVSFKNATENSPGVYTVSRFIRGFKGHNVPSHSSGERFILLTGYIKRIPGRSNFIGRTAYFKIPHEGQSLGQVQSASLTIQGKSLEPLPVTNISGEQDADENVRISWEPQERGVGKTAGENTEEYKVEILDSPGGNVLTTFNTRQRSVVYSKSEREANGVSLSNINVRVSKKSTAVGFGLPATKYPLNLNSTGESFSELSNVISYPASQGNSPKIIGDFNVSSTPAGDDKLLVYDGTDYKQLKLEDIGLENFDGTTDNVPEGSANLYFTNARVDTRLSDLGLNAIGDFNDTGGNNPDNGDVVSWDDNQNKYVPKPIGSLSVTLDDLQDVDASNTQDGYVLQWDSSTGQFIIDVNDINLTSTDELAEGSNNLYYTNSRAENHIKSHVRPHDLHRVDESNLGNRSIMVYDTTGTYHYWRMEDLSNSTISNTDDLPEGSFNLYYKDSRVDSYVKGHISLSDLTNGYINDLNDINTSGVTAGDALVYDGNNFVPGNPNQGITIDQLNDVATNSPQSNQILTWDGGKWTNQDAISISNLNDIGDVNLSSGHDQFLFRTHGSSDWEAKTLFSSKGDLLLGTGGSDFTNLSVGADGQVLVADSNQSEGVLWSDVPTAYFSIGTLSTNYTLQSLDHGTIFKINDTLTLYLPSGFAIGYTVYARMQDSGITLSLNTSGNINGVTQLNAKGEQVRIVHEGGGDWFVTQEEPANLASLTTDSISEGTTNLYFTDTRIDGRLANITIDTFGDITFNSLADGNVLYYESGQWVNKEFSNIFSTEFITNFNNSNIGSLANVEGSTPADDDILKYSSNSSQFQLISLQGAVKTELNKLNIEEFNNVSSIGTPNDGDVLTYNGSSGEWEPQVPSGDGSSNTSASSLIDIWLFGD